MSLSWKARRRWALVVLILGLPAYIVVAVSLVGLLGRPGLVWELLIFVGLGFLWMLPLRRVFLGVGRADPDAPPPPPEGRH